MLSALNMVVGRLRKKKKKIVGLEKKKSEEDKGCVVKMRMGNPLL